MNTSGKKLLLLILTAVLCAILLSGCSFTDLMTQGTGLKDDPDYQTWERLSESGKLDNEGKYTADAVHITFAENNYLEVHYFSDPQRKTEISPEGCLLLPGDTIYYSVANKEAADGMYFFDHLEIIAYGEDSTRKDTQNWISGEDSASIMIPFDYQGTEVSIEPTGRFGDRMMMFSDTVEDKSKPNGTWSVNNEKVSGRQFQAHPLENYVVEYRYDADRYYYINSVPAYWKADLEDGLIVFNMSKAKTGVEEYSVELAAYSAAEISVKDAAIISVENEADKKAARKNASGKWTVTKIRQGSTVSLITNSNDKNSIVVSSAIDHTIKESGEKEVNGQMQYLYSIEFGDAERFLFIPSEYACEHGRIRYLCNGKELTEKATLNTGMKIVCEAAEVEEGYWLPDSGREIVVNGGETAEALKAVKIYPYKTVSVLLDQPKIGGSISYRVNGEELTGESADLYCGTQVSISLNPDKGWAAKFNKDAIYTVVEANNQVIDFDKNPINTLFYETDDHKPAFTLELKGIGKGNVSIYASGYEQTNKMYNGNKFEDTTIKMPVDQKIGTDQGLQLIFDNMKLPGGKNALKVTVDKEANNGGYKEIYYIIESSKSATIEFDRHKTYKTVRVAVEAATTEEFKALNLLNVVPEVRFVDQTLDNTSLSNGVIDGTMISDERRIEVTIKPINGYYLTGSDTKNDIYQKEMQYKDYKNLKPDKLQEQVKKYISIFLDTKDDHGTVQYMINGQLREEWVSLKEGETIHILYTLKDTEGWEIEGELGVFTFNWAQQFWKGKSVFATQEKIITVTTEMDGKTIQRDPNIKLKRKGK